jgi:hypothetical protein
MATAKQMAANRANAQRSTGPKTAAGKMKSSRNAYRHGLSGPLPNDLETSSKVSAMVRALMLGGAAEHNHSWAVEFAEAHAARLRIRAVRKNMLLWINRGDDDTARRLLYLDRYERYADTRRRRAASKL